MCSTSVISLPIVRAAAPGTRHLVHASCAGSLWLDRVIAVLLAVQLAQIAVAAAVTIRSAPRELAERLARLVLEYHDGGHGDGELNKDTH